MAIALSDYAPRIVSASRAATQPRKRLLPRWRPPVVLLVEDDLEMRRLLARTLRREGLDVVEAADGDEALDWLGPWALEGNLEFAPDLIVSDIRLPYFSGLEILEGIRVAADRVPVILITGFPDPRTIESARELGAVCVLAKPFELDELTRVVRAALGEA